MLEKQANGVGWVACFEGLAKLRITVRKTVVFTVVQGAILELKRLNFLSGVAVGQPDISTR